MDIYKQIPEIVQQNNCLALESQLWESVQKAYAASRSYRAGDNPEYAKALAEFDRVTNPQPINVIPFRRREAFA